jgi:hypothetical protein
MASLDKYAATEDRFGTSESTALICIQYTINFIHDHLLDAVNLRPFPPKKLEISDVTSVVCTNACLNKCTLCKMPSGDL